MESSNCCASRLQPTDRVPHRHPRTLYRKQAVPPEMRRVAITGLGAICALGHNTREMWESLRSGRSGIAPLQLAERSQLRFQNGAEVRGYDAAQHFDPARADFIDRFAQFLELYGKQGRVHPLTIPKAMANAGASLICMEFGVTGPGYTVATACSSSNHAIGLAFWMVRNGMVEAAITGGSEATFSLGTLRAWEAMRVVSPDTCRPFSRDRKGMILGEGAAMLLLEPLEAARARGAAVLGEIVGFGMSSDAGHLTNP